MNNKGFEKPGSDVSLSRPLFALAIGNPEKAK